MTHSFVYECKTTATHLQSTSPPRVDPMPIMSMWAWNPPAFFRMPTSGMRKTVHWMEMQPYKCNAALLTSSLHTAWLNLRLPWNPIPRCNWQCVDTTLTPYSLAKSPRLGPTLPREDSHPLGTKHWHHPSWITNEWDTGHGKIQTTIWTYILEIWKLRNDHLHQNADKLDLPNYRQAVITLYEQRHLLPPQAQHALYHQPLEDMLELPTSRLQVWTTKGYDYFHCQLKAARKQATLHTPDIWQYFQAPTQQTNDLQPPWETLSHCTSVGLLCMHQSLEITLKNWVFYYTQIFKSLISTLKANMLSCKPGAMDTAALSHLFQGLWGCRWW